MPQRPHTAPKLPLFSRKGRTEQREEWEEGMPPESTKALTSHTPVLYRLVKICTLRSVRQGGGRVAPCTVPTVRPPPRGSRTPSARPGCLVARPRSASHSAPTLRN